MYIRFLIDFTTYQRLNLVHRFLTIQNISSELLSFLSLTDFNDYDFSSFDKINNGNIISLMLRKISLDNLVEILNNENLSKIHNAVLFEISKKSSMLTLTAEKIYVMTLALVLKQRNTNYKNSSITCDELIKLDDDRQRLVYCN